MIPSRRLSCVGRDQGVAIFNRETIEWQEHLRTIHPEPIPPPPVPPPITVPTEDEDRIPPPGGTVDPVLPERG